MRNQNHEGCINDFLKGVCNLYDKLSQQPAWTTNQIMFVKTNATFKHSKFCIYDLVLRGQFVNTKNNKHVPCHKNNLI